MLAQNHRSKYLQQPLTLMLTFDPHCSSFLFLKVYHSDFHCEDIWSFPSFAIAFSFNGPTFWIFYACCFCSSWRITSWEPFLATHTFVFGHRSWIGCLRLLWWVSYEVIKNNYIDEGFQKLWDFGGPQNHLWLRYLLAEVASIRKQLPRRTIARILESMLMTFSVMEKIF